MRQAARTTGPFDAPIVSRRRMRAMLGALVLAMACGDDKGEGVELVAPSDVTGTYTLRLIDNALLPAVVDQTTTRKIELLAETLTLNADRTFTDVTDLRETVGSTIRTATQQASGSYIINGNLVIFSYAPDGAKATATYSTGTLSMSILGVSYQYRRTP
jgi:hypothetical protein